MPGITLTPDRLRLAVVTLVALSLTAFLANSAFAQTSPFPTNSDDFLHPDKAFRMSVTGSNASDVDFVARWEIANEYYLYRDKIKIESIHARVSARVPEGVPMRDEFFGESAVFRHFVEVPFTVEATGTERPVIAVSYQGCADAGLCYPPVTRQIALSRQSAEPLPDAVTTPREDSRSPDTTAPAMSLSGRDGPVSGQFLILDQLKDASFVIVILTFLGLGLLLAFTPCILPMVPILAGIIARSGGNRKLPASRTFALSLSYVLAMAVTYSLFGVAMGLTGESLQTWFQQPWVISAFGTLFILLALSMFGLYSLEIPPAIQTRLYAWSNRGRGRQSTLGGAAIMGGLSALIVGPCTTAPLIGALLFIAQTGDAVIGGTALFFLALGMGIPLLIVGTSLGSLLPQPGPALTAVKPFFGLLLLGVAIWLFDRIAPAVVTLWASGTLLALIATYLYQATRSSSFGFEGKFLAQGMAAVALLYGTLLIAGAVTGGSSVLYPLKHLATASSSSAMPREHALNFRQVHSLQDLELEIALAEQRGQGIMLDFYADWCVACKELEAFTFSDDRVKAATADLTLLRADVTEDNAANKKLLKHFGLFGPPAILFFDIHGYEFELARVVGYMNADDFTNHLEQVFSVRRI